MSDRDSYCCITYTSSVFVCHQRYDLLTDSCSSQTQTRSLSWSHFERVLIFFSFWKPAGHCNKSVNFLNLLKFFPCLCPPTSRENAWSWRSVFVYCNQSWMSKSFFCPCADKAIVDLFNLRKACCEHSCMHFNTVFSLANLLINLLHFSIFWTAYRVMSG